MAIMVGPGHYAGEHSSLARFPAVTEVLERLKAVGIDLAKYQYTLTSVYTRDGWPSRPFGFDFRCYDVDGLTDAVVALTKQQAKSATDFTSDRKEAIFNEDKPGTTEGSFSLGDTSGRGFRQIGTGSVLHIEIALNGKCNAHVDSHGYVVGPDDYDWGVNALLHGYWDLLSDKISPLYGGIGHGGKVGPMILRPILGLDGEIGWYFGVTGYW